jgi:hypothetical protein
LSKPQKDAAEKTVEEGELFEIPMPAVWREAVLMTFGESPKIPSTYFEGELSCCRRNAETKEAQIIMRKGASTVEFIHEYAHYLAYQFAPKMVLASSELKNESWAKMCEQFYLNQAFLHYPRRFCIQFYDQTPDE